MVEDRIMKWENLGKVLEEYAVKLRNTYQDNLINSDSLASGKLLNSVEYIIEKDNMHISVALQLEDYWKYVEYDTKPHFPPVDKIKEWISVKPILPDNRFGKLPTPDQLAFLIGRKISLSGTTGTNDLHNAVDAINSEFMDRIEDAISKDVDAMTTVIFTEFFKSDSN